MKLHLWGTDFRRSTPEMRAKLFCSPETKRARMGEWLSLGFSDLVYLYTCNRIEFFTTAEDYFTDTRTKWIALLNHLGLPQDAYYLGYHLEGKSALRHLLRVACSLESLVVGEPQILGQLKESVRWNKDNHFAISPSLERSFNLAFETAKQVRTQTRLAEKPVSVATLGLQHLVRLEPSFPLKEVVVVGRSPISVLVVQWFKKNRPSIPLTWANRTVSALSEFPESEGVRLVPLSEFLVRPPSFSHMFTATASAEPLFGASFFEKNKGQRPLVFDFAEPPDVLASEATSLVELIHLEDLKEEARLNAECRQSAIQEAEKIIDISLKSFCLQQKEAPLLKDFSRVEPQFLGELESFLTVLQSELPQDFHPKIRRWAEKLVKRNLHLSREHLRSLLRTVTEPETQVRDFL